MIEPSLGLIQTRGLIAAIEAADAAAKSATVRVSSAEMCEDGTATISIIGELSAVQAAVDAGAEAAERISSLLAKRVIPRPDDSLRKILERKRFVSAYESTDDRPALPWVEDEKLAVRPKVTPKIITPGRKQPSITAKPVTTHRPSARKEVATPVSKVKPEQSSATITSADMEKMAVVRLRQHARTIENLPLKGRQISMANKSQLLEAIASVSMK